MAWFRFDSTALLDDKLIVLRKRFGFEGIGVYLALVMLCYDCEGSIPEYKLPIFFEANDFPNWKPIFEAMLALRLFKANATLTDDEPTYSSGRVTRELEIMREAQERREDAARKAGLASAEKRKQLDKGKKATPVNATSTTVNVSQPPNRTVPNRTLHNQEGSALKKNDDEKKDGVRPSTQEQRDEIKKWADADVEKLGEQFLSFATAVSDEHYAKKTWDQRINLRTENRAEFYRKCVLFCAWAKIKNQKSQDKARVLFHEIASFINDRGAMERAIDDKELAKRREFAEESGKNYLESELGVSAPPPSPEWE